MDVDSERSGALADDDHMDYEEEELGRDVDGDEMMGEGEEEYYEEEESMEAEPTIPQATPPITFPTITSPIIQPQHQSFEELVETAESKEEDMTPEEEEPFGDRVETVEAERPLTEKGVGETSTSLQPHGDASATVGTRSEEGVDIASRAEVPTSEDTTMPTAASRSQAAEADDNLRSLSVMSQGGPGRHTEQAREAQGKNQGTEEEYNDDAERDAIGHDDDWYPHDVHSLPPIVLNLPTLGARCLFTPLPEDEHDLKLPVWLKGRAEQLGEANLSDVWAAIRVEMSREEFVHDGEMVITEKHMDLKMGEDDINLQTLTLLELLRVHHGCGLQTPMQLFITFTPHRFITRFNAIKQEVEAQDKREASTEEDAQVEGGEEASQDGEPHEVSPAVDDTREALQDEVKTDEPVEDEEEYEGEEAKEHSEEASRAEERAESEWRKDDYRKRRAERNDGDGVDGARYGGSNKAARPYPAESAHPNADWARARLIAPMQIPGERIVMVPSTRNTDTSATPLPVSEPRDVPDLDRKERENDVKSDFGGKDKRFDQDRDTVGSNQETNSASSTMQQSLVDSPVVAIHLEDGTVILPPSEKTTLIPGRSDPNDSYDEGVDLTYDIEPHSLDSTTKPTDFSLVEVPLDEIALNEQNGGSPPLSGATSPESLAPLSEYSSTGATSSTPIDGTTSSIDAVRDPEAIMEEVQRARERLNKSDYDLPIRDDLINDLDSPSVTLDDDDAIDKFDPLRQEDTVHPSADPSRDPQLFRDDRDLVSATTAVRDSLSPSNVKRNSEASSYDEGDQVLMSKLKRSRAGTPSI